MRRSRTSCPLTFGNTRHRIDHKRQALKTSAIRGTRGWFRMLLNPAMRHHPGELHRCQPEERAMTEVQKMRGEKIYECDFNITGMTDYGVTLDALLSGIEKVPPQG